MSSTVSTREPCHLFLKYPLLIKWKPVPLPQLEVFTREQVLLYRCLGFFPEMCCCDKNTTTKNNFWFVERKGLLWVPGHEYSVLHHSRGAKATGTWTAGYITAMSRSSGEYTLPLSSLSSSLQSAVLVREWRHQQGASPPPSGNKNQDNFNHPSLMPKGPDTSRACQWQWQPTHTVLARLPLQLHALTCLFDWR